MFPPPQQRGQPISPNAFNALMDEVRSNQITSIKGGTFNRSIGGTSININSGTFGGQGAGSSQISCPFKVTDVSVGEDLKVQVAWGLVWNMLPTGMSPTDDPKFKLDVSETCYIYIQIVFNTSTLIVNEVLISVETELKTNTSTTQYNLIAVVKIDPDADPKVIDSIKSICVQPFPSPCSLS
jgi:hypothetical protein